MGDEYWKPEILLTSWNQADAGKIPVSGAGYRGRFYGPGFDSIWTDMSEIVRPTRDGIHGREYISTSVDIGPKPMRLRFTPDGKLLAPPLPLIEIQFPAILDVPGWSVECPHLAAARAEAARKLDTVAVIPAEEASELAIEQLPFVAPLFGDSAGEADLDRAMVVLSAVRMAQLMDGPDVIGLLEKMRVEHPAVVVCVRLTLTPDTADRIIEVLILAYERGGSVVPEILADLADATTRDLWTMEQVRTEALEQKINSRVVFVLPWVVLVAMTARSGAFRDFYATSTGLLVVAVGGLLSLIGVATASRLGAQPSETRVFGGSRSK
jgi:hypothetical protein